MFVIADLRKTSTLIICNHTKRNILSSYGASLISVKMKAKRKFSHIHAHVSYSTENCLKQKIRLFLTSITIRHFGSLH